LADTEKSSRMAADVRKEYEITGHTRFGGLLGSPVAHSISPQMHNYSFRKLGIDCVYLCFEVQPDRLGDTVRTFRELGAFGFNLTMPDKQYVLEYLDDLSPAARMIGAVNTVVNEEGRLIGHNTDGYGYMESMRQAGFDASGKEMTLLGAGGAASAIAVQAALDGVTKLHIANRKSRSWRHAEELVKTINENTSCHADLTDLSDLSALKEKIGSSYLLTNATSVGMKKGPGDSGGEDMTPVPDTSVFRPDLVVSDVIYNPRKTRLLREAETKGCRTFNGMYMLLYQGAEAFRLWTGKEMPADEVKARYFDR